MKECAVKVRKKNRSIKIIWTDTYISSRFKHTQTDISFHH